MISLKEKLTVKNGIILGIVLILIGILIGILFLSDIGFIFAGFGTVSIGISILMYINKDDK